jgi:hypothetical protein
MKWNGWGYEGTGFAVNADGQVYLTGSHYELSGKVLQFVLFATLP